MAALAETRDVGSRLPLPASVLRFCCIGDSLTYGQGVAPRQTLAAHVTRFANMVYLDQLVWVDNLGQSSGNVWHSWVPFTRLAQSIRFDVAIFSICQNDAQILESNSVRYGKDVTRTWIANGQCHPFVRKTISDIAAFGANQGIHTVLDFYTSWDDDRPLIDAIARECQTANLPFVDVLRFVREESGLSAVDFRASPFDGHPSDAAHHLVARRIMEEVRDTWMPARKPVGSVADQLLDICDQAMESGWSADDICHWALTVIAAKETVARRRRTKPEGRSLGDLGKARTAIEERYRRWYSKGAATASARVLHESRQELASMLEGAHASVRNLDELTFILENFRSPGEAKPLWAMIEAAGYFSQHDRLKVLPEDLRAYYLKLAEDAPAIIANLPPFFVSDHHLRHDLAHDLHRLAALLPDRLRADDIEPSARGLWQVSQYLVHAACWYLEKFRKQTASATLDVPELPAFFTIVDVRIERDMQRRKRGGVFTLAVEADYVVPDRFRRSYHQWAGVDEEICVYRFEMPLVLLGDLGVGVPQWDGAHKHFLDGELQIAAIDITNHSTDTEMSRRTFQWRPTAGTASSHWVKLDQILVPG